MCSKSSLMVCLIWSAVVGLLLPGTSLGQANFSESFDGLSSTQSGDHGPPQLIAAGWVFRNQSDPESAGDWRRSAWAYQGNWSLHIDQSISWWDGPNAEASSWAILPAIEGQISGDVIRFWYDCGSAPPLVPGGQFEIRYSPSGDTDTGSGADQVGDFDVLLAALPADLYDWNEQSFVLPGSGRIAFRYYIPQVESQSEFWASVSIDSLSVGAPGPGCNQPDPPAGGETVTWTAAGGPYEFCELVTIPEGSTVIVEPGAVIDVLQNAQLTIQGSMIGAGTASQPISITGGNSWITPPVRVLGTLDLQFADVSARLRAGVGGSVLVADCAFTGVTLDAQDGFLRVDRCDFTDGAGVSATDATLAVRDSSIVGQSPTPPGVDDRLTILRAYLYLDNVILDGSEFSFYQERFVQAIYLDNLSVSNNVDQPGLDLVGANFFVGSGVTLQGNQYPVHVGGSGILPGSVLPSTGNLNNYIDVHNVSAISSGIVWSDAGIPYVIDDQTYSASSLRIGPGVNVKLGPSTTFWGAPEATQVRGLPQAPVVIERLDPAQSWQGLQYFNRFENCIIDGGQIGARFSSGNVAGPGFVDNCVIQNCDFGTQNNVYVRKTRFLNNDTAVWGNGFPDDMNGQTNPNSFEGNILAVHAADDARYNWWGDPSGPTSPDNPGGTGDPVNGFIPIAPFLTSPPDFSDSPPVVDLHKPYSFAAVGDRLLVSWESSDDVTVASHRVLFKPRGGEPFQVVADNLPGTQRSVEIAVPDIPQTNLNGPAFIRVQAFDDAGQMGWDEGAADVPWVNTNPGTLTITSDLTGPFLAGQRVLLCWTVGGGASATISIVLFLDGDSRAISLGGSHTGITCFSSMGVLLPFVSTDSARIGLVLNIGTNVRKYFLSDYFAIRPDDRIGDQPPTITMLTPQAGNSFPGGSVLPITWVATDDEAVRSVDIQVSYDGGRIWETIAEDLPPETTSFNWPVPDSEGVADARVRVIVRDLRFQNSSDGADRPLTIAVGVSLPSGDINGDGVVDPNDIGPFAAVLLDSPLDSAHVARADLDGDGMSNGQDMQPFIQILAGP